MFGPMQRGGVQAFALAAACTLGAAACDDGAGPTEPLSDVAQFSREITFPQLQEQLLAGPTRVEIELLGDALVAREVELKTSDELADDEEIESRIARLEVAGDEGTLTLALGDLAITFTRATRFRAEDSDELTFEAFVARVETALADGRQPPVEAERRPPASPQDPDDASFVARELRLDDEADEPEIEINVDGRHLVTNDTPPPDGWIHVLGLMIELRVSEGITELEAEMEDVQGEVEFEGVVQSVDLDGNAFTLVGGTVVRLVPGTRIKQSGDDDQLESLGEVADALALGLIVEAEGEGVLELADPRTIVAIEVEFEVEEELDDIAGIRDFDGLVTAVNLEQRSFTLAGGTVVRIVEGTRIETGGDRLSSLAAVADALAAGLPVEAEGEALIETFEPLVLIAIEVEFEVED